MASGPESASSGHSFKGLPMVARWDPEALAREKAELAELATKGFFTRFRAYLARSGPGWLQSALTLGGGTAMASLYAGAYLKYSLLWVQPLAMGLGVVMFAAISHQALSTGERPFEAMKRHVHPVVAWAWAISTILATLIWHFPQYALAGGMTEDMLRAATGWEPSRAASMVVLLMVGFLYLAISTAITWSYGSSSRGVRFYERVLKCFVWMVVLAFGAVVARRARAIEWLEVLKGFLPISIPTDKRGVSVMMAAIGAAVGINMTFLFPYTLLARGWGKEHRELARFDLVMGMLVPYTLATSLIIITAGCTIYDPVKFGSGQASVSPIDAARMLEASGLPGFFARFVFGLGVLGMTLSTITLHMLVAGFAICEVFGLEPTGWRYRLACLAPAPGVLGVILWPYLRTWVAIPTSAVCSLMLPIAYIAFFILNNRRGYLGDDTPSGRRALAWNAAMLVAIAAVASSGIYYIYTQVFG